MFITMFHLLSFILSFPVYFIGATLDFEQMEELMDSVVQIDVADVEFTRTLTSENGLKFDKTISQDSFTISEDALIGCTTTNVVVVVEAYLANKKLNSRYPSYTYKPLIDTHPTVKRHGFEFKNKPGNAPRSKDIDKILKTGITVTVLVGKRQLALIPQDYKMQIVKISNDKFGLRIPQSQLRSFGLDLLNAWSSVSYKTKKNTGIVNLEIINVVRGKEYCYVKPMVKGTAIPNAVTMAVVAVEASGCISSVEHGASVVEVFDQASSSWEKRVQLEVDINQVTGQHKITGSETGSTNVEWYTFDDHVLWQLVMFKRKNTV